ncbi:MAG: hypothetical protein HUU60_12660 [Armatimonadetes bacterium]|nr:hypothetical protein [Armatimonadota bacterium]
MPPGAATVRSTIRIAWQGISCHVPNTWRLESFSGNFNQGAFTIASPGSVRLDVKWRRNAPHCDLDAERRKYLSRLESDFKRRRIPFSARLDEGFEFSWKTSEAKGAGKAISFDSTVVIAQICGGPRDPVPTLASEVFGLIADHGTEDLAPWEIYGLSLLLPGQARLTANKILSGQTRLEFRIDKTDLIALRTARAHRLIEGPEADWPKSWLGREDCEIVEVEQVGDIDVYHMVGRFPLGEAIRRRSKSYCACAWLNGSDAIALMTIGPGSDTLLQEVVQRSL